MGDVKAIGFLLAIAFGLPFAWRLGCAAGDIISRRILHGPRLKPNVKPRVAPSSTG